MLMGALAAFTLVALMGLALLPKVWRGCHIDPAFSLLHGGAALVGSGLAIAVALEGDTRIYANIGLVLVIAALGASISLRRRKGKPAAKGLLLLHAGLAVGCYLLLAYFTLVPGATLI